MRKSDLLAVSRQMTEAGLKNEAADMAALAEYSKGDEQRGRLAQYEMARFIREGSGKAAALLGAALFPPSPLQQMIDALPR